MALRMYQAVAELERQRSLSKTRDGLRSDYYTTLGITPRGKWKLIPREDDGSLSNFPYECHELYYLGVRPYGMINPAAHLICSQIARCFQGREGCGAGIKTPLLLEAPEHKAGKSKALKPNATKINSSMTIFPTAMSSFQELETGKNRGSRSKPAAMETAVTTEKEMAKGPKQYRQMFLSIQEHRWVLLRSLPRNESQLRARLRDLPLEIQSMIFSYAFGLSCECSLLAIVDAIVKLNVKKMSMDHVEIRAPLMLLRDAAFKTLAANAFFNVHEIIVNVDNLTQLLKAHGERLSAIKIVVGISNMDYHEYGNDRLEAEVDEMQSRLYDLIELPQLKSVKLVVCFWNDGHRHGASWTCDYDWSREADACPCCNRVEYSEIKHKMTALADPLLELERKGRLDSVFLRFYETKPGIWPRHVGPYAMIPRCHPCHHELYTELQCEEKRQPSCAKKKAQPGRDVYDGGEKNFQDDQLWAPLYSYVGFQIYHWIPDAIQSYTDRTCQCRLFNRRPKTWYPEYVSYAHRILWHELMGALAWENGKDAGEEMELQCDSGFSHSRPLIW